MANYTKKQRIQQAVADFVTIIIVTGAFLLIYLFITPYPRGFYCNDETIRFPYQSDTIPLWAAGLYGSVAGIFFVIIAELYINRQCCVDESEFHVRHTRWILNSLNGVLLFSLGAACTMLITEIGKHSIGRLRPHFIAVCDPIWEKIECFTKIDDVLVPNYIGMNSSICRGDPHLIKEARLSFPSGHSSFSTYSMVFVIIYLEARVTLKRLIFIKSGIQLVAFIAAWYTCMSRVSDFKHHYTDVMAGASIGISVALFVTLITGRQIWDFQKLKHEDRVIDDGEDIGMERCENPVARNSKLTAYNI